MSRMFIYLSKLNSAEIGSTERMHANWKTVRSSLTRSSCKCLFCIILQWMKHIRKLKFLSLHRAFWYSHSSFTDRCTFI